MACVSTATGFAANVLSKVLSKVLSCLWNTVVEEVKMVVCLPQAIADMKAQVQDLTGVIYDIRGDLDREQRNPKRQVQNWLDRAGTAIESSVTILNEYHQHKNCLGCCPNCLSRYRIGKHIRDWKRTAFQLQSERVQDFPPIGEYGDPAPRPQISIQNLESSFVANAKRSAQTERVERLLTDANHSNIRIIGILGMGGVGKSSLLDTINDSKKVGESFELIIKVTVSKNHILDLQNCVADRLELKRFPDKSNFDERKYMLQCYLKNKRFLILLDDIWADHDMWTGSKLQELGASLNDKGSKVVLTTRDKEVCDRMNVQETIEVEPLLQEEGWQLFRSRAFENRNGNVSHELEEVAREIAEECKGLPLAITVVAAAMKAHGTVLREWVNALNQMRNVPVMFDGLHSIVDTHLFQRLQWSYDSLRTSELKACFRSFALFPEDREIYCEEVINIWVAEGLVRRIGESYSLDTGDSIIRHLRNRCLIEVVDMEDPAGRIFRVKIHDILRDLAIRIAEKEHGCYFKAGQGVSDFPLEEVDSERCAQMSLMSNNIESLPRTFTCLSLSVLLLSENRDIKEVPESFLNELPSLRVLDLSKTGITSLPPSIGNLKHLVSLRLEYTNIRGLPETIGNLKELQFLNLGRCWQLRCLPESISGLKRLRALDIWGCGELSHLPRGISELVSLESLDMLFSNISLSFDEDANADRKSACLKDLQSLRRLRFLKVKMKSPVKEGVVGNWSKMETLSLKFDDDVNQGELPQDMQAMKDLASLVLWGLDVERPPSWLTQFRKLADLQLTACKPLKEVPAELPCLRELRITDCYKLEELELGMGFPKLESLTLRRLESLECVGAAASGSGSGGLGEGASPLPMLKTVVVIHCMKLKRLRGGWDKLRCLEVIKGVSREWWDAIECDNRTIKTSLESKYRSWE